MNINISQQEGFLILYPNPSNYDRPICVNAKEISHMSIESHAKDAFSINTHLRNGAMYKGCCLKNYQSQNANDALNQMIELCEMIMGNNLLILHPEVVL